jgi:hypothetical protein
VSRLPFWPLAAALLSVVACGPSEECPTTCPTPTETQQGLNPCTSNPDACPPEPGDTPLVSHVDVFYENKSNVALYIGASVTVNGASWSESRTLNPSSAVYLPDVVPGQQAGQTILFTVTEAGKTLDVRGTTPALGSRISCRSTHWAPGGFALSCF